MRNPDMVTNSLRLSREGLEEFLTGGPILKTNEGVYAAWVTQMGQALDYLETQIQEKTLRADDKQLEEYFRYINNSVMGIVRQLMADSGEKVTTEDQEWAEKVNMERHHLQNCLQKAAGHATVVVDRCKVIMKFAKSSDEAAIKR